MPTQVGRAHRLARRRGRAATSTPPRCPSATCTTSSCASSIGLHDGRVPADACPNEELDTRARAAAARRARARPSRRRTLKRYAPDQTLFYTVSGPSSQAGRRALGPRVRAGSRRTTRTACGRTSRELDGGEGRGAAERAGRPGLRRRRSPSSSSATFPWSRTSSPVRGARRPGSARRASRGSALPVEPPAATRVDRRRHARPGAGRDPDADSRRRVRDDADLPRAVSRRNFVLGGHFLSRLNRNLREEKGYTYGAALRLRLRRDLGPRHGRRST